MGRGMDLRGIARVDEVGGKGEDLDCCLNGAECLRGRKDAGDDCPTDAEALPFSFDKTEREKDDLNE